MRVQAEKLKATIDGREYQWSGGFGAVLTSQERGIKPGDVRMIGDVVFSAYQVSRSGWLREVSWKPQESITHDWLNRFHKAIFCGVSS